MNKIRNFVYNNSNAVFTFALVGDILIIATVLWVVVYK